MKKILTVFLLTINCLQVGCMGQRCRDDAYDDDKNFTRFDVQNIALDDVYLSIDMPLSQMSLIFTYDLRNHNDEVIIFDLLDKEVGKSQTITLNNTVIKVDEISKQWDGTATLSVIEVKNEKVTYKFDVDIQSGSSTIHVIGEAIGTYYEYCYEPGPS